MTDPAWGIRVLGVSGAAVIAVLLGLDQLPRWPDAAHLIASAVCAGAAAVFAVLPVSRSRRVVDLVLPVGPLVGAVNITVAMRVVDSATAALALSLLYVWLVLFYALYGRRWQSVCALGLAGLGMAVGLWEQLGGTPTLVYAVTTLAVLSVASVLVTVVSEQVRRASTTDALTGALSRRGLEQLARDFAWRQRSRSSTVAVVVLDLDGFKTYNDAHGHAAGDDLLVRAVAAWREALPPGSLLARTGGDEFVALVAEQRCGPAARDGQPGGRPEAPLERLLAGLRRAAPEGVRASAGAATWAVGTTLESATTTADEAMYADKGRRRGEGVPAPRPVPAAEGTAVTTTRTPPS